MANLSEAIDRYQKVQQSIREVADAIARERADKASELQTAYLMAESGRSTNGQVDLSTNL